MRLWPTLFKGETLGPSPNFAKSPAQVSAWQQTLRRLSLRKANKWAGNNRDDIWRHTSFPTPSSKTMKCSQPCWKKRGRRGKPRGESRSFFPVPNCLWINNSAVWMQCPFPEFGTVLTHSVACADTVSDPLGGSHVAAIDDARWKRGTQRMASHSVTAGEANMWKWTDFGL